MLAEFCRTANAIAATTKKSEKERLLADYVVTLDDASLDPAEARVPPQQCERCHTPREQGVGGLGRLHMA